jgi:hypothetical protein
MKRRLAHPAVACVNCVGKLVVGRETPKTKTGNLRGWVRVQLGWNTTNKMRHENVLSKSWRRI